jgi:predicted phage tail protein
LQVIIKPHSAFKDYFNKKQYTADLTTYSDIFLYLNGLHKRFIQYLRKQKAQGIEESFLFLDKNLRVINPDELAFKHARDGDVIHIVPAVVGGGGKRGGILAVLAVAMFVFLPMLAPALTAGAGSAAGAAAGAAEGGIFAGKMGGFLQNIVVNIGLALLSSLFSSKPKDQETRQNDMFGSLTNSTGSGTPICLNYGMVRVAGHMINGYVLSLGHAKSQTMNIYGEIINNSETAVTDQETKRSEFLEGFNSFT